MTLSELANALGGEKRSALYERLRHWTELDLLPLDGPKDPGTGRSRIYSRKAIKRAMVIQSLADLGVPVTVKPELVNKVLGSKKLQKAVFDLNNA